ncbi:hypothetical protein D3C81_1952690 [compost metagenome]
MVQVHAAAEAGASGQAGIARGSSTSDAAIMLPVALANASTPVRKRLVQLAAMP